MGYESKAVRDALDVTNNHVWKLSGRRWWPFYADALMKFQVIEAMADTIEVQTRSFPATFRRIPE
jgi:hypothetical protein